MKNIAVLLLAFGGPETLDEVEPFLRTLMEGRQVSDQQIKAIKERYRLIGGGSPLKSITYKQAQALELELNKDSSILYRVFVGMRYTPPFIEHAIEQVLLLGITDIIALPLTPYYNSASTGRYIQSLEKAIAGKDVKIRVIKSYNTNPFFIKAMAKGIKDTVKSINERFFIFSAHSLPVAMAKADSYVNQLEQTIRLIIKETGITDYTLAFQSKGMAGDDWLGPDVKDVMDTCLKQGKRNIAIVPLGFVSDHVETLYDIDIVYRQYAESKGLDFLRVPSLNVSDYFIQALKEEIIKVWNDPL